MIYNVVFEIQVEANDPLSATKDVDEMIKEPNSLWQWYVQEDTGKERVFSVDLTEGDSEAVQEINNYRPLIK